MLPDDRLVERLLAREEAAWEELLQRYGGLLAATCRRALLQAGRQADPATVADACSEVARHLLKDRCRLLRLHRPGTPLGIYLSVIAHSRTLDGLRLELSEQPLPEEDPADRDPAEAGERAQRLQEALDALPQHEADALRLFHLEGLPYTEIARRTGIPHSALGMVLSRARESLREGLGKDFLESV